MSTDTKSLILLIDDDIELLSTLSEFLGLEGFDVVTAGTGEEGLQKLSESAPDLIILDIAMPGMGGIGFLREMESAHGDTAVPVFVFTARANMEDFFQDVDVAGFLAKPCSPDVLLTKVKGILATSEPVRRDNAVTPAEAGTRKVLLVEDTVETREAIRAAFVAKGFDVVTVESGADAVEKTISERPAAVAMKLVMEHMNGDAVASMLDKLPSARQTPVILYDDTGSRPRGISFSEALGGPRSFVSSANPVEILRAVDAATNT